MKLYTFQDNAVIEKLQKGIIHRIKFDMTMGADPDMIGFNEAYRLLIKELPSYIGEAPEGAESPIWAYPTRPDLRSARWNWPKHTLIKLDIPEEFIVPISTDWWNGAIIFGDHSEEALNNLFIPSGIDDSEYLFWEIRPDWVREIIKYKKGVRNA